MMLGGWGNGSRPVNARRTSHLTDNLTFATERQFIPWLRWGIVGLGNGRKRAVQKLKDVYNSSMEHFATPVNGLPLDQQHQGLLQAPLGTKVGILISLFTDSAPLPASAGVLGFSQKRNL
jgi:hypothetical protein